MSEVAQRVRIVAREDVIFVRTPYSEANKALCKGITGGRWSPPNRAYRFPATPKVAAEIRMAFDGGWTVESNATFERLLERAREEYRARAAKDAEDLPRIPGHELLNPETGEPLAYWSQRRGRWITADGGWPHQRQAYWFGVAQEAPMLAMDMGTGKSKDAIALLEGWECERVLIAAPSSATEVWPLQFNGPLEVPEPLSMKAASEAIERGEEPDPVGVLELPHGHAERTWEVVALRKGSVRDRTKVAAAALDAARPECPVAVVINYEASIREPFKSWARRQKWDAVILDESHRIKAPGGVTSTFFNSLRSKARRRLCLTGTPLHHGPLDVYAQCRFLDPGVFGTSYQLFKQRYAIMGGYDQRQVVDYQDLAGLSRELGRIAYICESDEVLDLPSALPPERRTTVLDPEAQRVYDELEADFVSWLDDTGEAVTAANSLTRLLRLQQVTSGHVGTDEGEVRVVGEEKKRLLADLLADLKTDEPVVVFTRFIHDLRVVEAVCEVQGRRYGELSGRVHDLAPGGKFPKDRDVMAVQIQSGGAGIDLSRAAYAIYYSVGFSLGDYDQSRKRVHRPGQTRPVHYYHLVCEGTVDDTVFAALRKRQDVVKAVLAAAREG